MAATPTINWLEPRKGKNVDGATLPAETGVLLTSRNHLEAPSQYVVYKLVPKPFWRFWGTERMEETRLDALPGTGHSAVLGGRFFSEPLWGLPAPYGESGRVSFRAWTDTEDASSGIIHSAYLWLEEMSARGSIEGSVGASISGPGVHLGPKVAGSRDVERHWRVRPPDDPWVEVSMLQGEAVIEHLRRLEEAYEAGLSAQQGAMWDLPPDTMTYFVDHPIDDVTATCRIAPEEPLTVTLRMPGRADLRAAISLRISNLEDGSVTTSPPLFVTGISDRIVVTDLTFGMLRREPRDLLVMLDEEQLNVARVAERLGLDPQATWGQLVAATEELGADSVADAVLFAGHAASAVTVLA